VGEVAREDATQDCLLRLMAGLEVPEAWGEEVETINGLQ
jgi:hypothetical protein